MELPDTNPKTIFGVAKPAVADIPPVAILTLGQGMSDGARKYGRTNWREHEVTASVYYNAAMRHLMAWWDGEQDADDSGVHHLGHAMACLAILVDADLAPMVSYVCAETGMVWFRPADEFFDGRYEVYIPAAETPGSGRLH